MSEFDVTVNHGKEPFLTFSAAEVGGAQQCELEAASNPLERRSEHGMIKVFVVDPPWPRRKGGLRRVRPNQDRMLDYQTMMVEEIFHVLDSDVFSLAGSPHCVFLWGIDKFLHSGEQAMLKRDYRFHARFVWNKGNGVAPAFTVRYSHEYLTWFYKPKFLPIERRCRGKWTTVINSSGREHSRKPDEAYAMIDAFYPELEKMDVFSREKREGWRQYGDQTSLFSNGGAA